MSDPYQIVLATGNAGKVVEIQSYFQQLPIGFISQGELGVSSVEETGTTFVENAIIKARHAAQETGMPALADDSGLVVDALGGRPGVKSARYGGPDASDADRIALLLKEMDGVAASDRTASFYCALAFFMHADDPSPLLAVGRWEGAILTAAQGSDGFGYDPVFYLPGLKRSAAELECGLKNQISHRGKAMHEFIAKLGAYIPQVECEALGK